MSIGTYLFQDISFRLMSLYRFPGDRTCCICAGIRQFYSKPKLPVRNPMETINCLRLSPKTLGSMISTPSMAVLMISIGYKVELLKENFY